MRSVLAGIALLGAMAAWPVQAANDLITAISLSDLKDLLNSEGLTSELEDLNGNPALITDLKKLGVAGFIHIGGLACGSDVSATNTTTPCEVLEFAAVIEISRNVTDAQIQEIDRKFELSSIERVDATHVAVSDGVVLAGGITPANLGANIGFFAGQCSAAAQELNKLAGRTS